MRGGIERGEVQPFLCERRDFGGRILDEEIRRKKGTD